MEVFAVRIASDRFEGAIKGAGYPFFGIFRLDCYSKLSIILYSGKWREKHSLDGKFARGTKRIPKNSSGYAG